METKKSKYDTNPLDPDVERKAEEVWGDLGGSGGAPTQQVGGATSEVANTPKEDARRNVYSEAPTRRYDNPPLEAPYPSVFVPPTYAPPAQQYQQPNQSPYQAPRNISATGHTVAGVGIPERWALLLAYVPYVGLVASIIELLLAPRREIKVRFHAAQALALHVAILIISTILGAIASISDGGGFGHGLFRAAAFVFLIISMIRVWRGEPHRIAPLEEPARWFNQHIEPRNQT
jgi:uncharacterized membrane protein